MTTPESNRRHHERVYVNSNYRLLMEGKEYKGTIKNISFKGALLTMPEPELSSSCVSRFADLDVMVGDNEWLSFKCKIIHVTPIPNDTNPVGIGVFFHDHETAIQKLAQNGYGTTAATQSIEPERQDYTVKKELKIVIVGNVGAGKSTAVRAISEIPVIGTEAKATENHALRHKETTTVCMEYGMAHIESTKLHIYGTPGQKRFDFMADILCTGAKGMVILIDHSCNDPLDSLVYYLKHHHVFLSKSPGIIGITHFENSNIASLAEYHNHIRQHGHTCPAIPVDARQRQDIEKLLSNLLSQIRT